MDFYNEINAAVNDEAADNNKYIKLAEIAPTEKAKKILMDIAREEARHREYLQEILADKRDHHNSEHVQQTENGSKPHEVGAVISTNNIPMP